MGRFYKKAIQDILENRLLNSITVITIALSVLIVSAFVLFFVNASDMMNAWKQGIRVMAYLKSGVSEDETAKAEEHIRGFYGVQSVRFISKTEALEEIRRQMKRQISLFENLEENPLPNSFEICMTPSSHRMVHLEDLAAAVEALPAVDEVEYGQDWIGRFYHIYNLFKLTGYAMGGLFFMAAVFIVANTIRLVLYSRKEEIEIMRLVGATDGFIKTPFYIEGLILGALGGIIGLGVLFGAYLLILSNMEQGVSSSLLTIRFLTPASFGSLLAGSTIVGWLGCYLSLKQFLARRGE
jgi:cell division transport system permease protein